MFSSLTFRLIFFFNSFSPLSAMAVAVAKAAAKAAAAA